MRITNDVLIDCLNSAIMDYNQDFYKEEDKDKQLPLIDEEITDDDLKKLKKFRVVVNIGNLTVEEQQEFNKKLKELLKEMELDVFAINVLNSRDRKNPSNFDISFLEDLNGNVSNMQLRGIDLSKQNEELFEKFTNLQILSLEKCNISNPNLINNLDSTTRVYLKNNNIFPEYYQDMLKLMDKHNGQIEVSDVLLNKVAEVFSRKEIQLSTYLQLRGDIDFCEFETFNIVIDKDFNYDSFNLQEIIGILNKIPNATLVSDISDFRRLGQNGELTIPTTVIIKSAKELTANDIEEYTNISSVRIQDSINSKMQQAEPYKREEYLLVRREIDKILEEVDIPTQDIPDREKKIFAQIYKKLAEKIEYDYYAISKDGQKDEKLQITCRNLYGGLLQNKCVCAGYADILRNILSCVDIEAEYVGASVDIDGGAEYNLKDPSGHAWNRVTLDGKQYWTDLTWDRENIITERYPLRYCLKSTKDFGHKEFKVSNIDTRDDKCTESLSSEEQMELFDGERVYSQPAEEKEVAENMGYLSSMVVKCAEEGIRASELMEVANKINGKIQTPTKEVEDVQK